jgi:hypothetical protein
MALVDYDWYSACELSPSNVWGTLSATWAYSNSSANITSGDTSVEVMMPINGYGFISLTTTDTHTNIEFMIWFDNSWNLRVYEQNSLKHSTTYTSRDTFRIDYDSGSVKYYLNDSLIYTSASSPAYTAYVRAGHYLNYRPFIYCTLDENPITWSTDENCDTLDNLLVSDGSEGNSYTKTAQSNLHFRPNLEDAYVYVTEVKVAYEANIFGFTETQRQASQGSFDYLFRVTSSTLEVVEKWSVKDTDTVAVGDTLKITSESGTIKYYKNEGLLYTSLTSPPDRLFVVGGIYYGTYGMREPINHSGLYRQPSISPIVGMNF